MSKENETRAEDLVYRFIETKDAKDAKLLSEYLTDEQIGDLDVIDVNNIDDDTNEFIGMIVDKIASQFDEEDKEETLDESTSGSTRSTATSPSRGTRSTTASPEKVGSVKTPSSTTTTTRETRSTTGSAKAPARSSVQRSGIQGPNITAKRGASSSEDEIKTLANRIEAHYRVIMKLLYYTNSSPSSFLNSLDKMPVNLGPAFDEPVDIARSIIRNFSKYNEITPAIRKYLIRAAYTVLQNVKSIPGSEHYGAKELYIIRLESAPNEDSKRSVDEDQKKSEAAAKKIVHAVLVSTASAPQKNLIESGVFKTEEQLDRAKAITSLVLSLPTKQAVKRYIDFTEELNRRIVALKEVLKNYPDDEGILYTPNKVVTTIYPLFFYTRGKPSIDAPTVIVTKETVQQLEEIRKRLLNNVSDIFVSSKKASTKSNTTFDLKKKAGNGVDRPTIFLSPVSEWIVDQELEHVVDQMRSVNKRVANRDLILDALREYSQADDEIISSATTAIELGIGKTRTVDNLMRYILSSGKYYTVTPKGTFVFSTRDSSLETLLNAKISLGYSKEGNTRQLLDEDESVDSIIIDKINNRKRYDNEAGREKSVQAAKRDVFNRYSFSLAELSSIDGAITVNHSLVADYGYAIKNADQIMKTFKYIASENLKEGGKSVSTDDYEINGVTVKEIRDFIQAEHDVATKLSKEETARRNAIKANMQKK